MVSIPSSQHQGADPAQNPPIKFEVHEDFRKFENLTRSVLGVSKEEAEGESKKTSE